MANSCKYYKQKKQFSTNSGQTWQDVTPFEYRRGSFIEADSPDCREGTLISRWVTVPDAFLCDGKDKYEKQVGQYSLDNGATWLYYYPSIYQTGNLIESNADVCNNKWEGYYEFTGDTPSNCPIGTTYVEGRGCVGIPTQGLRPDPVKYIRCSSNTSVTLTSGDVFYNDVYVIYTGKIGDCVTAIGNWAFYDCSSLRSVTIPDSVTSIGMNAFYYCTGLTSVAIPDSVTSIGEGAFWDCISLTSATIGNGVTNIGDSVFYNCSGLTSVDISDSVTAIGNWAFYDCSSLRSVTIPDSVTSIGQGAFAECSSLTSVTIPSGVTRISSATFADCSALTSVTIPSGVTFISNGAFSGCTSLTSVTIEATTPPIIGITTFSGTNDCLFYVPCDVVNTYRSASGWRDYASRIVGIPPCAPPTFSGKWLATYSDSHTESAECGSSSAITNNEITKSGLTSVEIGDCVTAIGNWAFSGFYSLTSVTIPDSVTNIGMYAFNACTGLTSVAIPDSVTSIGEGAFIGGRNLASITINATTPPTLDTSVFDNTNNCPIYVPAASVSAYQNAWSQYASRIQPIT